MKINEKLIAKRSLKKLSIILNINNPLIQEEFRRGKRKHFELNEKESTTYSNFCKKKLT